MGWLWGCGKAETPRGQEIGLDVWVPQHLIKASKDDYCSYGPHGPHGPPPRRKLPVSEGLERIKKCKSWQADKLSLQLCVDSEKSEGESKTERV